jgi:hypothetical protein
MMDLHWLIRRHGAQDPPGGILHLRRGCAAAMVVQKMRRKRGRNATITIVDTRPYGIPRPPLSCCHEKSSAPKAAPHNGGSWWVRRRGAAPQPRLAGCSMPSGAWILCRPGAWILYRPSHRCTMRRSCDTDDSGILEAWNGDDPGEGMVAAPYPHYQIVCSYQCRKHSIERKKHSIHHCAKYNFQDKTLGTI